MIRTSTEFLTLTSEAAALIQRGMISFANAAAKSILGDDCVGKSARELLGPEITCVQAASFIGDVLLRGCHYIARVNRVEESAVVFLSLPDNSVSLLNDAFMFSLRSSLMSLGLSLEAARGVLDAGGDEKLSRQLAVMSRNYFRVYRIVSNAALVRAKTDGSLRAAACEFDLAELLGALVEGASLLRRSPELRMNAPAAMPIMGDPGLIRQMLMNLLANCYIHADACSRISVSLMDCGESVILSVDDDGCGIPPERLHSVFDRYNHPYDMKTMGGGAGLGLTVVRSVAQLHGGTLLMESKPGRGTTVRASLNKRTQAAVSLRAPDSAQPQLMPELLVGLADCLSEDCFAGKYSD